MATEATAPPPIELPPPSLLNEIASEPTSSSSGQTTQRTKTTRSDSVLTTTTPPSSTPITTAAQANGVQDVDSTATGVEKPFPPAAKGPTFTDAERPSLETTVHPSTPREAPLLQSTEDPYPETTTGPLAATEEHNVTAEKPNAATEEPKTTTEEPTEPTTSSTIPSPPAKSTPDHTPVSDLKTALAASLPPPPTSAPHPAHLLFRRPRRPLTYKSHAALTHLTIPTNSSSSAASNNSPFIYPPPAPRSAYLSAPEFAVQKTIGLRNADGGKEGEVIVEGVAEGGALDFAGFGDEEGGDGNEAKGREMERVEWVYRRKGRRAVLRRVRCNTAGEQTMETMKSGESTETGTRVTMRDLSGRMDVLITDSASSALRNSISNSISTSSGSISNTTSPTDLPLITLTDATDLPSTPTSLRSSSTSHSIGTTSLKSATDTPTTAQQQRIKISAPLLPTSRSSTKFTVVVPNPTLSPVSPSPGSPIARSPASPAAATARTVTLKWRTAAPPLPSPPLSAATWRKAVEVDERPGAKGRPLLVLTMDGDQTAVAKIVLLEPPSSQQSSSSVSSPVTPKTTEKKRRNPVPTLALQLGPAVRVDGQAGLDARGHLVDALVDEGVVLATGLVVARRVGRGTGVVL